MATVPEEGLLVARVLAGAWRQSVPSSSLSSSELIAIEPLLVETRSVGLAWHRIRHSELRNHSATDRLKKVYLFDTAQVALLEHQITEAVRILRSEGIDPLLAKGWLVGRLYPNEGLRPYADIDLCVRPEQYQAAATTLSSPLGHLLPVDLHKGFRALDRSVEQLYRRSRLAGLNGTEVRVVGPEDHFRLLCIHMLDHGAFRPLWLCDIALVLESLPENFDWDRCLAGSPRQSNWVACAIALAHELLGAQLNHVPVTLRATHLPSWLVPSVVRQWGTLEHYMHSPPMSTYLRHPAGVFRALRLRWPNPIQATVGVRGPFNEFPRLPFQLAECARRTAKFMLQVPKLLRSA